MAKKSLKQLENELRSVEEKRELLKAEIKEQQKQLNKERRQRHTQACTLLGEFVLESVNANWYEIDPDSLSALLKNNPPINLDNPLKESKESLNSLKQRLDQLKTLPTVTINNA